MMCEFVPNIIFSPRNIRTACDIAGISPDDACSLKRTRGISHRRFHVMSIMRSWDWSLPRIAMLLGGIDHTSVLYGIRRWEVIKDRPLPPMARIAAPRPCKPIEKHVYWRSYHGVWQVRLNSNADGYVGMFTDYDEAVAARDAALRSHVEAA